MSLHRSGTATFCLSGSLQFERGERSSCPGTTQNGDCESGSDETLSRLRCDEGIAVVRLDPSEIYERGLQDLARLVGAERLVFMLQDFDNLMEMEGWDHFFLYDHHFIWYPEMKDWLRAIGDVASLAVLDNYESHLKRNGVPISSEKIRLFLSAQDDSYLEDCPDWCEQYCELRTVRWAKVSEYLESHGQQLQTN
jgi:hypothetical protein